MANWVLPLRAAGEKAATEPARIDAIASFIMNRVIPQRLMNDIERSIVVVVVGVIRQTGGAPFAVWSTKREKRDEEENNRCGGQDRRERYNLRS